MLALLSDPNEPRAQASERVAAACRELHRLHLERGWFDERGLWYPNDPAAVVELPWTRSE